MGRKKKKTNKIDLKKLYSIIIFIITIFIAWKTPALEIIDNTIANTGLANRVNTVDNSEVLTKQVKHNKEIEEAVSQNIIIDPEKLNILYLNVGQADSELIINNGKVMLIDCGNSKDGENIVNGLRALGIEKIDYLIGTHIHEDHIGGMSYIVNALDIGEIYLPYNESTTSTYYKKLLTAISEKNLEINELNIGDKIMVSDAECEVMSVDNNEPENPNEASIVIEMSYKDMKYLFMGDAETKNEKSRQWDDIDVLKVGHHGSNTSTSEEFLKQVLPEIAIVSVGKDNSYGLPKDKILKRIESYNCKIYRTDLDGTIQIVSDGSKNAVTKIDVSFDGD